MTPKSLSCPSCGASHDIRNPGVIMYVCEYCGNAVYWDEEKVQSAGKQSVLPEGFSRLYRGATGSLHQKRFSVLGRVRYSFGRGFWDEWYLEFADGVNRWLTEDNHELAVQAQVSAENITAFSTYKTGSLIHHGEKSFLVQEVGHAECVGLEGDLPKMIESGEKYPYVDASSPDGNYTLGIEFDDEVPTVFVGRWLKHAELKLDDEGLEW